MCRHYSTDSQHNKFLNLQLHELQSYTVTRAHPPVTAVTCNWQQSSQIRKRALSPPFKRAIPPSIQKGKSLPSIQKSKSLPSIQNSKSLPSLQNRRWLGYFEALQGDKCGAYLGYVSNLESAARSQKSQSERFSPDRVSKQGSKVAEIA